MIGARGGSRTRRSLVHDPVTLAAVCAVVALYREWLPACGLSHVAVAAQRLPVRARASRRAETATTACRKAAMPCCGAGEPADVLSPGRAQKLPH
jgi:hypothetical protein